jgi:hypothetical protein
MIKANTTEKKAKVKAKAGELPNVVAEVILIVEVHTQGHAKEVKTIDSKDIFCDVDKLSNVTRSVAESDEVDCAVSLLYEAALKHKDKYPDTKIRLTPCYAIKELEEIL